MKTKYGIIPNEIVITFLDRYVGKVYKLLALHEENCDTLNDNIESTIRELFGVKNVVEELKNNGEFLSLIGTLESLIDQTEHKLYRKDVFKCISLVKKLKSSLEG